MQSVFNAQSCIIVVKLCVIVTSVIMLNVKATILDAQLNLNKQN